MSLESSLNSEDDLQVRQMQERNLLQAEIQKLKKEASKGDKRKKQEASARIAQLEAELDEQHNRELSDLRQELNRQQEHSCTPVYSVPTSGNEPSLLSGKMVGLHISNSAPNIESEPKKASKAQKRKEKKAVADKARHQAIEEQELLNRQGSRHIENEVLKETLSKRGLELVSVPADGDCLYKAVQDQLQRLGNSWSVAELRQQTATYMKEHSDSFLPFMTDDSGQPMTDVAFADYCHKVETTSEWGGHLEICALSHVLRRPLEVIQAEGASQITGEEYSGVENLLLVYHRHLYGLGEHYSSTTALRSGV